MSTPAAVAGEQPDSFAFTPENLATAEKIVSRYPADRKASAVIPLLHLAQRQNDNWLPRVAQDYVADYLGMPHIRVYEVATFYTMFNHRPVGKHLIEVCTTTSCALRGADEVLGACKKRLGVGVGETTADGKFTLVEVECAGACVNAPVVAIGEDYYEDLDGPAIVAVIDQLDRGETPTPGSQTGRRGSCPATGPTTLTGKAGSAAGSDD